MGYYDDMIKAGREDEIGLQPIHSAKGKQHPPALDLDYLAEDLRPIVQDYLNRMTALARRSTGDARNLALRYLAVAKTKISQHQWPL